MNLPKRIVLSAEIGAQIQKMPANALPYREQVWSICNTASRLGIEVALHGVWSVSLAEGPHFPPAKLHFNAGPEREDDVWIGRDGDVSLADLETVLLRKVVIKLDAALVDATAEGRQIFRKNYQGAYDFSAFLQDARDLLVGKGIPENFHGVVAVEARYIDLDGESISAPQVPTLLPPSSKRPG